MATLALVGGHSILGTGVAQGAARTDAPGPGGTVAVHDAGDHLILQRHGLDTYRPAHLVDHCANLRALAKRGCERVLALGSVGSLHRELPVGTFLAPDDFIALHAGRSCFDDARGHVVPGIDPDWRRLVIDAWRGAAEPELRDGGTYWESIGPRFETPAEIRLIAAHADVVGMTIASESIAARELGLAYAAVCVVDNLANGIEPEPLTAERFEAGKARNTERLLPALEAVLPALAARSG